ncbi:hypothetical protein D3C78_1692080 [compost metagenome]
MCALLRLLLFPFKTLLLSLTLNFSQCLKASLLGSGMLRCSFGSSLGLLIGQSLSFCQGGKLCLFVGQALLLCQCSNAFLFGNNSASFCFCCQTR